MKVSKCIVCLTPFSLLFGCSNLNERNAVDEDVIIEESHDYNEVKEYELVWDSMFDVNMSQYYVYFYSASCNHCEELKDYMIKKALTNKNIYFVKGSSRDQIGKDQNKSKNAENPGDIWILGYPSLIQITGHKCTKNLAGTIQIKGELK